MALPTYISPEEYLRMERQSETKHEYLHGEVFARASANEEHNLIAGSTHAALYPITIRRSCKIYPSAMRVRIPATGLYTYPDITIVCETPQFEDSEVDTLRNPTVIVEVLSPSTENYDRGKKFEYYRSLPTFQEYLLIDQERVYVEHYYRLHIGRWEYTILTSLAEAVNLQSITLEIPLRHLYEQVDWLNQQ